MEIKEMKVLIFEVNQEFYAIDILDVERILTQDNITEMPDTLPIVAGVMNYESSIMPVIDLSKKFNKYYANVRILDEDDQLNARLALVQATSIVLTEALRLLGVNAPKEM